MANYFIFIFFQCFFVLQIIFYIFHFLVLLLLIKRKNTTFKGSFYEIYKFLLIDDIVYFLITIPAKYIPEYGLWRNFFLSPSYYGTIFLAIYSFLLQAEFFGSTLLALNRFTILWNTKYHNMIWNYPWYFAIILIAPLGIMYQYSIPSVYMFTENGLPFIFLGETGISAEPFQFYSFVFVITTFLEGIITVASFIKYYRMLKAAISSQIKKQEIRLLFVSCIIFMAQIFRCFYSYFKSSVESESLELYTELNNIALDICALSRSISLIILSSTTRRAFKELYFSKNSKPFFTSDQIQIFGNKRV